MKKELNLDRSLNEILQILSVTLFEKTQLFTVLTASGDPMENEQECNLLPLFDF